SRAVGRLLEHRSIEDDSKNDSSVAIVLGLLWLGVSHETDLCLEAHHIVNLISKAVEGQGSERIQFMIRVMAFLTSYYVWRFRITKSSYSNEQFFDAYDQSLLSDFKQIIL